MVGRVALIVALLAVTAVHAADKCPGKCLDSAKSSCSDGKFVKGLCGGGASIQCCVPTPKPAAHNSCAGTCQDKALPCGAAYISGVCPGAANVQCCPKAAGAATAVPTPRPSAPTPAPAQPQPNTPVVRPNAPVWPAFRTLWQKYPHGEAEDVKRRIGGGINAAYITNTCTIRVSRAFTEAGMSINPITLANGNQMLLVKGGNGVGLPIRVREFSEWVVKRFGQPQVKVVNPSDGTEDVPQQFLGKKGLIKFDVRVWSDASGHFDLWDGEACAHNCYFDKAREVWLWTIA